MAVPPTFRARAQRLFLGEDPRSLLLFASPTLLGLSIDLLLRPRALWELGTQAKFIYGSSLLISAALWVFPIWALSRLFSVTSSKYIYSRIVIGLIAAVWILPFVTLSFGGQALYYRVVHSYMGRDTVRLGIALRGTVMDWFTAWGSPLFWCGIAVTGVGLTTAIVVLARKRSQAISSAIPLLPILCFPGSLVCCWTDNVDSRFLQAATPDACFAHALVHAARVATTGKGMIHQGMSVRSPAPLPPLASTRTTPMRVMVILTESVRADALCSESTPTCIDPMLDSVLPDRISLGKLTTQNPNTFSSCMVLWTGLAPNVSFQDAHTAPVIWELAKAIGYKTIYVTSQNPKYEDFGAFTQRAGIDRLVTGTELGGAAQEQLGAPDERATTEMLNAVRETTGDGSYLAVMQLSNTHSPYRIDPESQPFSPHAPKPLGDVNAFHNHYRNAVRFQERTVTSFLTELRKLPGWDDTVVLFLSDHGEQFREHGGLYHNHSLYDEELRIPGFLAGGSHVVTPEIRTAVTSYSGQRTYTQDVHGTIVDLLGLYDQRATLPLAKSVAGRSLIRPRKDSEEPTVLLATSTSVWEPDDARFGVMNRERILVGAPSGTWNCFDMEKDPNERTMLPSSSCGRLLPLARREFASAGVLP